MRSLGDPQWILMDGFVLTFRFFSGWMSRKILYQRVTRYFAALVH